MKLILEQLSDLRKRALSLKESLADYSDYLTAREITSSDASPRGLVGDSHIESQFQMDLNTYAELLNLLTNAEYITARSAETIEIGTKFIVKFTNDNQHTAAYLVEKPLVLGLNKKFVSIDSPLGKSVFSKSEKDNFQYTMPAISSMERQRITGTIEKIVTEPKEYTHFIREKDKKHRISESSEKELRRLRYSKSEEDRREYARRNTLTPSQIFLLRIEKARLEKSPGLDNKRRYNEVSRLLETAQVAEEVTDGSIGIGTTFDILITDGAESHVKTVEMINYAVSDELDDAYIERISPAGSKAFGLKANDKFSYRSGNKTITAAVLNVKVVDKGKPYTKSI